MTQEHSATEWRTFEAYVASEQDQADWTVEDWLGRWVNGDLLLGPAHGLRGNCEFLVRDSWVVEFSPAYTSLDEAEALLQGGDERPQEVRVEWAALDRCALEQAVVTSGFRSLVVHPAAPAAPGSEALRRPAVVDFARSEHTSGPAYTVDQALAWLACGDPRAHRMTRATQEWLLYQARLSLRPNPRHSSYLLGRLSEACAAMATLDLALADEFYELSQDLPKWPIGADLDIEPPRVQVAHVSSIEDARTASLTRFRRQMAAWWREIREDVALRVRGGPAEAISAPDPPRGASRDLLEDYQMTLSYADPARDQELLFGVDRLLLAELFPDSGQS